MEIGVLLEVVGLEVVGPQHPQVVLEELGPLLLDHDRALPERLVLRIVVLLHDRLHRVGFDPGLRGVVHTAWQIAVGVHGLGGAHPVDHREEAFENGHASTPCHRRDVRLVINGVVRDGVVRDGVVRDGVVRDGISGAD